jgi:hypothetical protein
VTEGVVVELLVTNNRLGRESRGGHQDQKVGEFLAPFEGQSHSGSFVQVIRSRGLSGAKKDWNFNYQEIGEVHHVPPSVEIEIPLTPETSTSLTRERM